MIRINLLPHKRVKPADSSVIKLQALVYVVTAVVLLGVGGLWYLTMGEVSELSRKDNDLKTQLADIQKKIKDVEGYEKTRQGLEVKLALIGQIEKGKIPATPFMNEINNLMIKGVWVSDLSLNGASFNVALMALSRGQAQKFFDGVKASRVFSGVVMGDVKDAPGQKQANVVGFTISGKLAGYEAAEAAAQKLAAAQAAQTAKAAPIKGAKPAPQGATPAPQGAKPAPPAKK